MLQVQHEGGDIDEGQLQRLEVMIEQLGQERQKYQMLLAVHMVGFIWSTVLSVDFEPLAYLSVSVSVSTSVCLYVCLLSVCLSLLLCLLLWLRL